MALQKTKSIARKLVLKFAVTQMSCIIMHSHPYQADDSISRF